MKVTLAVAAVCNALWGVAMVAYPAVTLAGLGFGLFSCWELWRYAGLTGLVFALGYGIAASNPFRYWPLVLLGLAEKTAATASLLAAAVSGAIPWNRSWPIAAGLVWIPPLFLILRETSRRFLLELDEPAPMPRDRLLLKYASQQGFSLYELSALRPTLTVFLRHEGCPFCREALADLSKLRPSIEIRGAGLAFVHMSSEPEAEKFFAGYCLSDVPRFSDPSGGLYRAFALRRAQWLDLLGPRVWKRGLCTALLKGHGLGVPQSDALRMPGVFLLSEGVVVAQHRHASPAEQPDYLSLLADIPARLPARLAASPPA
jgi:hypothetical protein